MQPAPAKTSLLIESPAFDHNDFIPVKFTCDGENVNPALTIKEIPGGTKSLVLIVDDPDAPHGTFDHWIVWNITPTELIPEDSQPGEQGENGFGNVAYGGPCPPDGEAHRYFFKVYALDAMLNLKAGSGKQTVVKAMENHILASGEIIGTYKRTH